MGRIITFLCFALSLSSCFKEPDFALTPVINFDSISSQIRLDQDGGLTKDSVVVTVYFEDGDGDLGYSEIQKEEAVTSDNFNYLIKPFRKQNGVFKEFQPLIPYSGYFPSLSLESKPGPIEGYLSYSIDFFHAFTPKFDTLKFEIQLKDSSGNLSNSTETEEIVLNRISAL
ncbi:hypothetical protein [uncultured Arcticibacterium sp.]|uniref:hypothetical protein n=1 Tax=uncultured Arcticibacterium sp. TaxID=2173042 RepID=UPI0030FAB753